jgi:hypothetical protein
MPSYSIDDLDDLELAAEAANPEQQLAALEFVATMFEENSIVYGIMGGFNFYLRGSGRTTDDVDIAVDNPPRMDAVLDIFNDQQRLVPRVLESLLPQYLFLSCKDSYCI